MLNNETKKFLCIILPFLGFVMHGLTIDLGFMAACEIMLGIFGVLVAAAVVAFITVFVTDE